MADRKQFLGVTEVDADVLRFLEEAGGRCVSDEELREQRISFAFGNSMNSKSMTKKKESISWLQRTYGSWRAYSAVPRKGVYFEWQFEGIQNSRRIQEQNLLRQYDLLLNCIEIGLAKGIEAFDKYTLWGLNAAAVANIAQFGGRYREEPIYVGNHLPPHFKDVPNEMDRFFSVIHENWTIHDHRRSFLLMPFGV